ncbi:hypothetical protein GCM10028857_28040 [Salinarchaeum chitinilyticum]
MRILGTVKEVFQASNQTTTTDDSKGAYWCHDCQEPIRDADVEGDAAPDCPACGDSMTFERSTDGADCAC